MADFEIDELVPVDHPMVIRILGTEKHVDPSQTVRRMIRAGEIPHVRIGTRMRVSIPVLRKWATEQIAKSMAAQSTQEPAEVSAGAK